MTSGSIPRLSGAALLCIVAACAGGPGDGGAVPASRNVVASCSLTPTNDVPLDAEEGIPLLYSGPLKIFHVYWAGDWDSNPANFRKADIERAMQDVIATPYYDKLCQYGVQGFTFDGSAESVGLCGSDPGPTTSTLGVLDFMACEEYTPADGVPTAGGAPNPLTCVACGVAPIDCFNVLEPLCVATPNPTGDHVYVVFLPKGTTIDDFGRKSCVDYGAFHFQVPSRALFSPIPPFTLPGSQGRPLNIAIIPTDCFSTLADLIGGVTHEVVEAATDPLPLAHWIDTSTATRGGSFDLTQIGTLLTDGEISDICGNHSTNFTAPDGTSINVATYWSNADNACVSLDVTPPVTTATANPSGTWVNTDVTVSFSSTDPGADASGVAGIVFSLSGAQSLATTIVPGASATVSISAQGITQVSFHAVDNAGNVEAEQTLIVRIDKTPPQIAGAAAPPPNGAGWNNTPVTVTFACSDALSGIASCTAPVTLAGDGAGQSVTGTAVDQAGNSAQATVSGLNIDRTPPVITYSGNIGTYTVDLQVTITCAASDNLSGVASSTCADVDAPAYTFPLGATTLSATAVDVAGNTGSGSTTFEVIVTEDSLCNLTQRFSTKPQIAGALCTKLDQAKNAPNAQARAGMLGAYRNQLAAQTGKAFSAGDAAILDALANAL